MMDVIWRMRSSNSGVSVLAAPPGVTTPPNAGAPASGTTWRQRLRREFELWRWRRAYARQVDDR